MVYAVAGDADSLGEEAGALELGAVVDVDDAAAVVETWLSVVDDAGALVGAGAELSAAEDAGALEGVGAELSAVSDAA